MSKFSKKYGGSRRVKNVLGLSQISIDLKPDRSASDVYVNQKMDLTELVKYVDKNKKAGHDLTYFYTFLAAIGRVVYNRQKMNYFVANRHIYEHEKVVLGFVAKVEFSDAAGEVMILLPIEKDDTVFTLANKVQKKLDGFRNKNSGVKKEGANSAIDVLGKMPNVIRVPLIGLLKWCDKKGILPAGVAKDNLYYSTMIVSNLGSIGCDAIYHNLNDFGNSSSLLTMGKIKDEEVVIGGKKVMRKTCEWGMNFDERIADGYYFAKSGKMLQYVFDHPEMLEESMSKEIPMDEIR